MASRLKKVGSLGLGLCALALVMANAAMTHGCAGSQATQQATSPPGATSPPATDPDCVAPSYMYATKAPVYWTPPIKCAAGKPTPMPPPPAQANAVEQAR
jgi:hypothetical protein